MPRGKRRTNDDKIAALENQISATETRLSAMREELSELYQRQQAEDVASLLDILKKNNISISQVESMIQQVAS